MSGRHTGGATDIERQLLVEHTRRNTDRIVRWIGNDPERMEECMKVFLGGDPLLTQRSAWVVGVVADQRPGLLTPWLGAMVRKMREPGVHDAVRRNVVRALQFVEIPSRLSGKVAAICFDELESMKTPVAVKVFAMTVLAAIAERRPDLGREVRLVIERQVEYNSGAFRARARHVLARLGNPRQAPPTVL